MWGDLDLLSLLQKTNVEQLREKELADTKQKLSQKEQEIKTMKKKVSSVCRNLRGPWHKMHVSCRRQSLNKLKKKS